MSKRVGARTAPLFTWLGLLLVGLLAAPAHPLAQAGEPYRILSAPYEVVETGFQPFGGYRIRGKKLRGFADFDSLVLDVAEEPARGRDLKVVGAVFTSSGDRAATRFQIAEMNLSATDLSFKTEAAAGVSYEFAGRFLRRGALSRFPREVPVLEGVLTKYVNGAREAEGRFSFHFVVSKARYYVRPSAA